MDMDIETGIEMIKKAYDEDDKRKTWELYLVRYPYMTEDTFMTFEEFYHVLHIPPKTSKDILCEVEKMLSDISWVKQL